MTEHTDQPLEEESPDEEELVPSGEEIELNLLRALLEKGPALPVELAVRTFSLPDEISDPLQDLESNGFIARQQMKRGEMYVLTKEGYHLAQRSFGREAF